MSWPSRGSRTPGKPAIALPTIAAVAALLSSVAPSAQSPPPVFRVSQDLVLVDVVATDGDGKVVTDLRAEELVLTEDGKPQRILDLQFASGSRDRSSPAAAPGAGDAPAGPRLGAAFSQAAPAGAPALVVAFDLQSMRAEILARARQAVAEVVSTLPAGSRLMLVTLDRGLTVRQQFTTDARAFSAALDAIEPAPETDLMDFDGLVDQADSVCGGTTAGADMASARQQAIGLARLYLADVRVRMSAVLDGLGALSRLLAPRPGRKHVVLYSTGYPTRPVDAAIDVVGTLCGDRGGVAQSMTTTVDASGWMTSAIDDANRAQVSVYAVDPRGLVPDNVQARQSRSARASQRGGQLPEVRRQQTEIQQFLRTMAGDTGGLAVLNSNDLTRGLRNAVADANQYYLLAFAPQGGRKAGRFYRLGLKTTRPGVQLRYRQGYLWLDPAERAQRDVSLALRFPALYGDPPIEVDARAEGGRVKAAVVVPTSALRFTAVGEVHQNDLNVTALLRDAEGKVVGDRYLFSKDVAMKLSAERLADLQSHENIEIPGDGPAPKPGSYELVVVVRHSAGRISAGSRALTVP